MQEAHSLNGLFLVSPAISPAGTLTFTPYPGRRGTNTVTVQLHDNGGVIDGGQDTSSAQTFTIAVGLADDTDGDQMPDDFEAVSGLAQNDPADKLLDPDGDGFTNLQEFTAGTHPRNSADCLRGIFSSQNGQEMIRFPTVPGKRYRVERKDNFPAEPWVQVGVDIEGTGEERTLNDPAAPNLPKGIYRVRIVTP